MRGGRLEQGWQALLECLFPPACAACGEVGLAPFCPLCARALVPAQPVWVEGLERTYAAYEYGGSMAAAVRALKYDQRPEVGRALGALLYQRLTLKQGWAELLAVPVPSSTQGLRARGYSPARELVRGMGFAAQVRALRRVRDSDPQVGLSGAVRRVNQRGAFEASSRLVRGRCVLVVDDVLTTGSTLEAAGAALRGAGAESVYGAVLAHAAPPDDV